MINIFLDSGCIGNFPFRTSKPMFLKFHSLGMLFLLPIVILKSLKVRYKFIKTGWSLSLHFNSDLIDQSQIYAKKVILYVSVLIKFERFLVFSNFSVSLDIVMILPEFAMNIFFLTYIYLIESRMKHNY